MKHLFLLPTQGLRGCFMIGPKTVVQIDEVEECIERVLERQCKGQREEDEGSGYILCQEGKLQWESSGLAEQVYINPILQIQREPLMRNKW